MSAQSLLNAMLVFWLKLVKMMSLLDELTIHRTEKSDIRILNILRKNCTHERPSQVILPFLWSINHNKNYLLISNVSFNYINIFYKITKFYSKIFHIRLSTTKMYKGHLISQYFLFTQQSYNKIGWIDVK